MTVRHSKTITKTLDFELFGQFRSREMNTTDEAEGYPEQEHSLTFSAKDLRDTTVEQTCELQSKLLMETLYTVGKIET